jgi:Saxitoxin biosynthesis operon protein SxtJ
MRWSDLPLKPSPRMLRQFACLWTLFFAGLGAWHGLAHGETRLATVLIAIALTIGPAGMASPAAVRPIFVTWMILAFPIGWLVSRVVLVTLFVLIIPVALLFRISGRDPLLLRRPPGKSSYWTPKAASRDVRSYLRQF